MSALPCPVCAHTTTTVVNTRLHRSYHANTIRRNRVCPSCDLRFETIETLFTRPSTTKLTPSEVHIIRTLHGKGVKQAELARRYKVSAKTIHLIVHNYKWTVPESFRKVRVNGKEA